MCVCVCVCLGVCVFTCVHVLVCVYVCVCVNEDVSIAGRWQQEHDRLHKMMVANKANSSFV